jgi:mannose-6-phosphate isomerase
VPSEPRAVTGVVKHYAWGDPMFIPRLVGAEPNGRPWAELWLGTHPKGPAVLGDGTPLEELTGPLPYLLKVVAASQPLSLQAHPDARQAIDGYRRGVYPDDRAKPELLVALTQFEALCGLRPAEATMELFAELRLDSLAERIDREGPAALLADIYHEAVGVDAVLAACARSDRPEARWVCRLEERYPGEPSVAATLLLNYVQLSPGDALHLTAGNLHAYLGGAGIELMGPSDNVVRGGLTVKRVDVDELLRILDPTPLERPVWASDGGRYPLPEADCALVRIDAGGSHVSTGQELSVSLDGTTSYLAPGARITPVATTFVVVATS